MEFQMAQETLVLALQRVGYALPGRQVVMPILQGIKITAAEGGMELEATDLEVAIRIVTKLEPDQVATPGAAVVPGRQFSDFVKALRGQVRIVGEDGRVLVEYGGGRADFAAYEPDQFPAFPEVDLEAELELPVETLKAVAARVGAICGDTEAQPLFTGVFWEAAEGRLRWVGTDTHRLAVLEGPETAQSWSRIVPARTLATVARLTAGAQEPVKVLIGASYVAFEGPGFVITTRLLQGKYPNWRAVMPRTTAAFLGVGRVEFEGALERALLVARTAGKDQAEIVRLDFGEGRVNVSARGEAGTLAEAVPAETGGAGTVYFNGRYLLDALEGAGGERVRVVFGPDLASAVVEADGYRHLVLPVIVRGVEEAA